jgi:hypothetical protein
MNENQLMKLWSDQRSGRIRAHLAPTILLAVILGLSATGHLTNHTDVTLRLFGVGLVAACGLFSLIAIFSTVRDGVSLIRTLEEIKGLSLLAKDIRNSVTSLTLSGFVYVLFALFNFALLVIYLFKK